MSEDKPEIVIELEYLGQGGFIATDQDTRRFACGQTPGEAIGELVRTDLEKFNIRKIRWTV